jgi:curved DNA-binding protein CbpA
MRTHYAILEVSETASQETITATYRSLCKRYHPDVNDVDPIAGERIKEINLAYEILSDPTRRCAYDDLLRSSRAHTDSKSQAPPVLPNSRIRRDAFARLFRFIAVAIAFAWILLLVTDTKILIWETKVEPGQQYYVAGHGELQNPKQGSLVGRYFNGRRVITQVYWYSPNNIFGRDSCPLILRD